MHNLLERIVKGIKVIDANQTPMEFDMSDDAVEAWTDMYGEPPNNESFSKFINFIKSNLNPTLLKSMKRLEIGFHIFDVFFNLQIYSDTLWETEIVL